jgi:hypothetical protein
MKCEYPGCPKARLPDVFQSVYCEEHDVLVRGASL